MLDGIQPPKATYNYSILKFFSNLPSNGFINNKKAVLLILNKTQPYKSYVLVERFAQ